MRGLQQAFSVIKSVNKTVFADLASIAIRFAGTIVMGFGGDGKEQVSLGYLLQWGQQGPGVHIRSASDQPTEGQKNNSSFETHGIVSPARITEVRPSNTKTL